ncbi:MAG: nuclear transport factor 2 family protein [Bacteroidota bacterium]|nr:nuclear transport factor 2 family protein [Bacteroidota bacterium]MDP4189931.1 nuclear transport factor 2 family protein [Bacteroidota bacterium]MDP4194512.1 nuclear transport factor 2 family protein [Bacteroidota bacterium]
MERDCRLIVENYLESYNRSDVDSMLKLFSEDMLFESISNTLGITQAVSREQFAKVSKMMAEQYEERKQTPIHWVISENAVAIETEYWCRLAKDLSSGPNAGEGIRLRGASFFTIENGLIKRLVDYM